MTLAIVSLIGWFCLMIGLLIGCKTSDKYWKDKAVTFDKAQYYIDDHNNKKWRWK